MRRVIAALVVVGLAVAIVLLWPRDQQDDPPATVAGATTTTSTSIVSTTSTTGISTTLTTKGDDHVVETVAEAEDILRDLWFGWFEGIYNQDEERIREVVILDETVETAEESFGNMTFSQPPQFSLIRLENSEILRSDGDCLAIWSELDVSAFRPAAVGTSGVYVMRFADKWALLSVWKHRSDLWEADCESQF